MVEFSVGRVLLGAVYFRGAVGLPLVALFWDRSVSIVRRISIAAALSLIVSLLMFPLAAIRPLL